MRKKIYINLITVFLLLFQADILFGQTNNKIIITVGKYPITYFDLFKEVKMISILTNSEINENNREQIKKLAIASLIKRKIKISEIEKLGIKNYSKIELEKLTEFPEKESKQLLKFCELKWSPESLQFYNRTNIMSKTSSQTQIRNPIYKKNKNDFLNYQEFLKPFGKKYHWFN